VAAQYKNLYKVAVLIGELMAKKRKNKRNVFRLWRNKKCKGLWEKIITLEIRQQDTSVLVH